MGDSASELISTITPFLLGTAGICACIALAMAIGRYFLYEHGADDLQPVSKRVTHVFGYLAAIAFVAVGGANMAKQWKDNTQLNPAANGAGSSLVPEAASKGNSYSNIGDLIMDQSKVPDNMSADEAGVVVHDPNSTPGDVQYAGLVLNNNIEGATPEMISAAFFHGQNSEEYKEAFINAYGEDAYNKWRESLELEQSN